MADPSIPTDILAGVAEALDEVGKIVTLRKYTKGALDPQNPSAGKPVTPIDVSCLAFLYDYEDKSINGTTILEGDRVALVDMSAILPAYPEKGDDLIEDPSATPITYRIINTEITEVQAVRTVALLQIRK